MNGEGRFDDIGVALRCSCAVFYLFVSVALICFVLYLGNIVLSKMCILYCLVSLNSVIFKPCFDFKPKILHCFLSACVPNDKLEN